jgi:glycosyltransferase involved in cell wall biosynthesis
MDLISASAQPLGLGIAQRKKTGFSVPVRDWLSADLPNLPQERGLRGWSRIVARSKTGRRFLTFLTDAYGGHGGIALYNRDMLQAMCNLPECAGVVALPRHMPNPSERRPAKLRFIEAAIGGKLRYLAAASRLLRGDRAFDLVVCGHINLMPLAYLVSWWLKVPIVLFIYGIDAWQPTRSRLVNALARRAQWVASISEVTAQKFRTWNDSKAQQLLIIPNAIHTEWYGSAAKNPLLIERYGLEGKTVLMTLGRLVSAERYKGFDEVLEILPTLSQTRPDLVYMIVGDGSDRSRLESKVAALGLTGRVVFTGLIAEQEKADHYRLADVYVMASRGEGFGFVLLEAMACGIPVIASKLDGGREAVLNGQLGAMIDPGRPDDLRHAIISALDKPKGIVPAGLEHYSFHNFESRMGAMIGKVLSRSPQPLDSL